VGGIKEVVVDGETGFLVPIDQMEKSPFEPRDPEKFARDLAARINQLIADPDLCAKFGRAGRKRAAAKFSWAAIAAQTKTLYEQVLAANQRP
jgi:glycosyltransferase involved in cell wall biosynthesis